MKTILQTLLKIFALLIIVAYFTACAPTSSTSTPDPVVGTEPLKQVAFPGQTKYYPSTAGFLKGRIYMTHGFGGDLTVYDQYPFNHMMDAMQAQGFEIITYNQPANVFENFRNGGKDWRDAFTTYLRQLIDETERERGPAPMNIAGGVSFGGLHALMATEIFPDVFDGFFASVPVTDYTALSELQAGSSEHFTPFEHPEILASKKGFIQYGMQDDRVRWQLTVDLLNEIDSFGVNEVTRVNLGMVGHTSTEENVKNLSDWTGSL